MVGVGVGSGEWRELDASRERDELNPIIFLRAPEIFRPTPCMLATRTNKNKREQLDSGYINEIKMKLLPESCSSKSVDNLAAKKWERGFLKLNLSQNPMTTRARICERECEWVCEHESITPSSRPLYKERMGHAHNGRPATMVRWPFDKVGPEQWSRGGSRPVGSAGPLVALLAVSFGRKHPNGYFKIMPGCFGQILLETKFKIIFFKGFWNSENIFGVFVKRKKELEKF